MLKRPIPVGVFALSLMFSLLASTGGVTAATDEDGHVHDDGQEHVHDHDHGLDSESSSLVRADRYGEAQAPGLGIPVPGHMAECELITREFVGYPSLRESLGLGPKLPDPGNATESRLGIDVTPEEASAVDRAIALEASAGWTESFASPGQLPQGIWDYATATLHVYTDVDISDELKTLEPGDYQVVVHEVESRTTQADVDRLTDEVSSMLTNGAAKGSIDFSFDFTCGKVLVLADTRADFEIVRTAVEASGIPEEDVELVLVVAGQGSYDASRNDHHPNDIDGGFTVWNENVNSGNTGLTCTNSIPFGRSGGGQWIVTAAHCVNGTNQNGQRNIDCGFRIRTGSVWLNPTNDINNCMQYAVGGNGYVDVAFFAAYSNQHGDPETLWHGGNHSRETMDAWQLLASSSPTYSYQCHSGRNWGSKICGYVINSSFNTCTATGCVKKQILVSAPAYGGDSGGTVWEPTYETQYSGVLKGHRQSNTQFFFSHLQYIRSMMADETGPVGLPWSL